LIHGEDEECVLSHAGESVVVDMGLSQALRGRNNAPPPQRMLLKSAKFSMKACFIF